MAAVTIQSVELVNFMCHSHLKICFDKPITCIGGRNGSGKSAVMIALGVLFGQRAQALDRGTSYANLIKTGTNQATIKVVINNYLRHRYDTYGDQIVIEKRLREKTAKISIYNSIGKVFNVRKNELESIVERYGLRLDNPLNFLTQEKSKRFLNVTKPEDLYEFYYVGTEFKNIEEELEEGLRILEEMKVKMAETSKSITEKEVKLLTQRKNLDSLSFDPDKALEALQNEENWMEANLLKEELKKLTENIERFEAKLNENREESRRLNAALQENVRHDEESTKEIEEKISRLRLQLHEVAGEVSEYTTEHARMTEQIEMIRGKNSVAVLENDLAEAEATLGEYKSKVAILTSDREDAFQAFQSERRENDDKVVQVQGLRRQLNYLKQNAVDSNKKTDLEWFRKIDEELKKTKFRDRVIGPVCKYVKLKEYKWFKTASIILKNGLMNYIVFNSEDKLKLHSVFNRLGVPYSVSQMFSKEPLRNLRTNSAYKTLLDVLQIDDPIIANQLIILNNIEQIILVEDRSAAHRIIKSNPQDVDCAYTVTGDRIRLVNGSLSDFRPRDDGVYWFEDKDSKIKKIADEIAKHSLKDEAKTRYNCLSDELGRFSLTVDKMERKCRDLRAEIEMLREASGDLDAVERKQKLLARTLDSLKGKKAEIEAKIGLEDATLKEISARNLKLRQDAMKEKSTISARIRELSFEEMRISNDMGRQMVLRTDTNEKLSEKAVGKEPDKIRSPNEIAKERQSIFNFKLRVSQMEPKEQIEKTVAKLECEIAYLVGLRTKFEGIIEETVEACEKRKHKRDELKTKDTEEAVKQFREYTMRSGYVGEMVIDHNNRRLDLRMKVHNSEISGSKSTLSGGERSFAGVCFLLSMWKCFKCPVKVLDEFDVFMDSINRKVAIQCLLEFFKMSETQVILITPLDTSDLMGVDCDIKIIRKVE